MTQSSDAISSPLTKPILQCLALRLISSDHDIYPATSAIHLEQNKFPTRMCCGRKEDADWQIGALADVIQEVFRGAAAAAAAGPSVHLWKQHQPS